MTGGNRIEFSLPVPVVWGLFSHAILFKLDMILVSPFDYAYDIYITESKFQFGIWKMMAVMTSNFMTSMDDKQGGRYVEQLTGH